MRWELLVLRDPRDLDANFASWCTLTKPSPVVCCHWTVVARAVGVLLFGSLPASPRRLGEPVRDLPVANRHGMQRLGRRTGRWMPPKISGLPRLFGAVDQSTSIACAVFGLAAHRPPCFGHTVPSVEIIARQSPSPICATVGGWPPDAR